jgi:hypothetical protein
VLPHGAHGLPGARLAVGGQQPDVLLEVLPHAERPVPGGGQQHRAYVVVVRRGPHRVPEGDLGRDVQRVHRLRAVQRDRRESVAHLVQHGVGHGVSPPVSGSDVLVSTSRCPKDSMTEIAPRDQERTCDLRQRILDGPRSAEMPRGGAVSQSHRRIEWFCSRALPKRCRLMLVIGS